MEIIGYLAGLLTLIAYLPQTIKTIRTRKTKDLSLVTFIFVGVSATLWVVYGLGKQTPSIWVTNGIVAICSALITAIKIYNRELK